MGKWLENDEKVVRKREVGKWLKEVRKWLEKGGKVVRKRWESG